MNPAPACARPCRPVLLLPGLRTWKRGPHMSAASGPSPLSWPTVLVGRRHKGGYCVCVEPDTQYARVDKERVAYQVVGGGPPDLVMSAGTYGTIDQDWEDPMVAGMYRRLAAFSRLIRLDRRGSGSSDPLPLDALPSWESHIDEVIAVMDAAGSERAAIMGIFDAGPMATLFAATRPGRTVALILANTYARLIASDDRPPRGQEVSGAPRRSMGWRRPTPRPR